MLFELPAALLHHSSMLKVPLAIHADLLSHATGTRIACRPCLMHKLYEHAVCSSCASQPAVLQSQLCFICIH